MHGNREYVFDILLVGFKRGCDNVDVSTTPTEDVVKMLVWLRADTKHYIAVVGERQLISPQCSSHKAGAQLSSCGLAVQSRRAHSSSPSRELG